MAEQGIARLGQSALQFKQDFPMAGQVVSKFEQGSSMVKTSVYKADYESDRELRAKRRVDGIRRLVGNMKEMEQVF
jgi:hypothetical protein